MREKCSSDSEEIGDSDSGLNVYRLQKTKKFKRKEREK